MQLSEMHGTGRVKTSQNQRFSVFKGEGREGGMEERERYEFIHSDLLNFSWNLEMIP